MKTSNTVGIFECISDGCTRKARSVKKPGRCNTCYSRISTGAAPKFPADPLLDYMERKNLRWDGKNIPKRGMKITLERMDEFCIDHLGVHPFVVYGDLYFKECVS